MDVGQVLRSKLQQGCLGQIEHLVHRNPGQQFVVDAFATDEGVHKVDEELVGRLGLDPARIAWNGLGPVGPVVVRLVVAKGLSSRLPNPTDPPLPSCRFVR